MGGDDAAQWSDFAVAVAGAAAALSGLLFVAVSINIQRILSFPQLPIRAAQTLVMLVTPLVISVVLLVPAQSRAALGGELIGLAVAAGGLLGWMNRPSTRSAQETAATWAVARFGPSVAIAVLLIVAGVTVPAQTGGGLYWVAPAVLIALLSGLGNAWVLLVEILR
jgi:hypothetical protein